MASRNSGVGTWGRSASMRARASVCLLAARRAAAPASSRTTGTPSRAAAAHTGPTSARGTGR